MVLRDTPPPSWLSPGRPPLAFLGAARLWENQFAEEGRVASGGTRRHGMGTGGELRSPGQFPIVLCVFVKKVCILCLINVPVC